MDTSGLHRHLPSQAGARNRALAEKMLRGKTLDGPLKAAAIEQLATIPEPWLDRLADENLAYVALGYGETLADTEILRGYTPEKLHAEAARVPELKAAVEAEVEAEIAAVKQADPESTQAAFAEHSRPDLLAEKLAAKLNSDGLGFQVRVMRDSTPLEYLQNEFGIADDPYHDVFFPDQSHEEARETHIFRSLLVELNGEGVIQEDGQVDPASDVLLVPYKVVGDKRVSPVSQASYASIDGTQMDNNHGVNIWPNRLIVVDDEVVALPSRKMGYHSVLLHESGHAIDYAAESIPGLDHRHTMDQFYQKDIERYKTGENVFLTPRAMDNVREYFAEAVEAYLTQPPGETTADFYKPENNFQQLQTRNPELFAYIDKVLTHQNPQAPAS